MNLPKNSAKRLKMFRMKSQPAAGLSQPGDQVTSGDAQQDRSTGLGALRSATNVAGAQFRVSSDCLLPAGFQLTARHFVPGQWVFVSGWTKGRGYHGVMKRWGFQGGGSDQHGHKKNHRSAGSLGQRGIGKVWKFKKMAGHKGPDPRCVNAKVFRIESARNLIFLKGPLPGYKGSIVKISDARGKTALKNLHIRLPYPTFVPMPNVEYPVTLQEPPPQRDPFLYPEQPLYQPDD
eukprot:s982_g5.t1